MQSRLFYADLLPYLHHFLRRMPWGAVITMLDAGCATGAGADLLGLLHQTNANGHRYQVTGIDLETESSFNKPYADANFPHMTYVFGDIFEIGNNSFDVVVCSHVIEHFKEPSRFMRKLQSISRLFALFYCPFEEKHLLKWHLRSINRTFIEAFDPSFVEVRESLGWRHPDDETSRCAVFALPGPDWGRLDVALVFNWSDERSVLPMKFCIGERDQAA
jgi:SAM-dependent methyltransferase